MDDLTFVLLMDGEPGRRRPDMLTLLLLTWNVSVPLSCTSVCWKPESAATSGGRLLNSHVTALFVFVCCTFETAKDEDVTVFKVWAAVDCGVGCG